MTLSAAIKAGMLAGMSAEGLLTLLLVEHPELPVPVRLTNDRVATTHAGDIYTPAVFEVELPAEEDGQVRAAAISIFDPAREITAWLRAVREAPEVTIRLVRLDDPDSLEHEVKGLRLEEPRWEPPGPVISARLVGGRGGDRRYPARRFVPSRYPGLF